MKMQLDLQDVQRVVEEALLEDIGKGDISTLISIPAEANSSADFVMRQDAVVCGLPVLTCMFNALRLPMVEGRLEFTGRVTEGELVQAGTVLATIAGNARAVLMTERVALNLLQRLCGIATQSRKYAEAVVGTNAIVLDTRKTTPGLRLLEKYAVSVGGCHNHRLRLDDGIMLKDNHLSIGGGIRPALQRAKQQREIFLKEHPEFEGGFTIQVECDTLEQLEIALEEGITHILLDNMDAPTLRKAVSITSGRAKLEASGGVTLSNIRELAQTGVDTISVGALTHSVPAVDIGLDIY